MLWHELLFDAELYATLTDEAPMAAKASNIDDETKASRRFAALSLKKLIAF